MSSASCPAWSTRREIRRPSRKVSSTSPGRAGRSARAGRASRPPAPSCAGEQQRRQRHLAAARCGHDQVAGGLRVGAEVVRGGVDQPVGASGQAAHAHHGQPVLAVGQLPRGNLAALGPAGHHRVGFDPGVPARTLAVSGVRKRASAPGTTGTGSSAAAGRARAGRARRSATSRPCPWDAVEVAAMNRQLACCRAVRKATGDSIGPRPTRSRAGRRGRGSGLAPSSVTSAASRSGS